MRPNCVAHGKLLSILMCFFRLAGDKTYMLHRSRWNWHLGADLSRRSMDELRTNSCKFYNNHWLYCRNVHSSVKWQLVMAQQSFVKLRSHHMNWTKLNGSSEHVQTDGNVHTTWPVGSRTMQPSSLRLQPISAKQVNVACAGLYPHDQSTTGVTGSTGSSQPSSVQLCAVNDA